jgi:hypothetical protein
MIEINRTKLTPETYGHCRIPRTTSYERTCQAKKEQTSADQATEHIEWYFRIRMTLVHSNSCECTKSELDLFEVPPT